MDTLEKEGNKHLFFGKYKITKKIGSGSFGNVYQGINIIDKKKVAIKLERKDVGYNLLQKESYYLYNLKGIGIPEIISYGYSGNYNVLVQGLLGDSLGKIFFKNHNFFPLKDICMFTIQILHRIEYVHSKNLIHRDIKPENFLIGEPDKYMIYIIDFGLSKKYRSSRTNKHIQFKMTKKFTGTARYASINAVRGAEQSRRDDLEAIGYMLMYFLSKGKLPWQGISCKEKAHKYAKIYNLKKNLDYNIFCKGMPSEIIDYMKYCKDLAFEKDPDYEYLRNLFENALKRNNFENDLKFSWIKDYSILKHLKNSEEIKNKIVQINLSKRKTSPQSRIYKQLESAREMNKLNIIKTDIDNNNNNSNTLINNKSQVNLLNNNPIVKARTYNLQDMQHKKFNSSWDIKGLKTRENDRNKSSIAKYNSSIDDESPYNNLSNINDNYFGESNNNTNNTFNLKYIYENKNKNFSNNDNLPNKYYSNNNLFYFSNNVNINQNDFSKSLVFKNKTNENTLNDKTNIDNEKTNKTDYSIPNLIKNENSNLNNTNNINKNNNHSPNLIKSLSYVKKYNNEIGEIKVNFGNVKNINKHTRNNNENINNITSPINEKKIIFNMKGNNNYNIPNNKKKRNKGKINDIKKLSINKVINSNDLVKKGINPILVNKNKNLVNSKIKIKNNKILENNTTKIKKTKIIKPKQQNVNIKISPNNMNSKSYINIFKKRTFTNNLEQNTEPLLEVNKINNSNFKKEHLKIHNLSPNLSNNIEGKINKIKSIQIHSNIKKDNNYNNGNIKHKRLNTEIIFKTNANDEMNLNQKRINKYKNLRHKMNTKSGNLTLQKNDINNYKGIPKPSNIIHKTINSTINNNNKTINNTIHSNNNNNTIISIYNNYNINKNSSRNGKYKDIPRINFDYLNNNNNGPNNENKYYSYNGYKLDNYNNYILINQRKSPTIIGKQKNFINFDNYPSIIPRIVYNSPNIGEKNNRVYDFSYQDNNENSNLKNYFSIKGNNIPKNENKDNKIMNINSFRQNLNSLKIKKILTEMKYNNSKENILNKKEKKIMDKNNIGNMAKNRNNSYVFGKKVNYQSLISKNKNKEIDFENNYPVINRKKTEIFYQKLPKFKMNFDIDDTNLIQDNRNNTPRFRRHEQIRDYFDNYFNENKFFSPKY